MQACASDGRIGRGRHRLPDEQRESDFIVTICILDVTRVSPQIEVGKAVGRQSPAFYWPRHLPSDRLAGQLTRKHVALSIQLIWLLRGRRISQRSGDYLIHGLRYEVGINTSLEQYFHFRGGKRAHKCELRACRFELGFACKWTSITANGLPRTVPHSVKGRNWTRTCQLSLTLRTPAFGSRRSSEIRD